MRWRLHLEYDGAGFAGWQVQPGQRTVQGVVEEALERFLGHPVRVFPAGRTDAGVHAKHQVIRFDTLVERTDHAVLGALASFLPPDVACWHAAVTDPDFDPRHTPHKKLYRYRFLDRGAPSALRRSVVWHVRRELDVERMQQAAACLQGTHDFSSFRATGCASTHPVRTVVACRVVRRHDEVHLECEGTGFLRHMVRIVAGTAHEVGIGKRKPAWMLEVLKARSRVAAGRTAPAHGLCLERIWYDEHAGAQRSP